MHTRINHNAHLQILKNPWILTLCLDWSVKRMNAYSSATKIVFETQIFFKCFSFYFTPYFCSKSVSRTEETHLKHYSWQVWEIYIVKIAWDTINRQHNEKSQKCITTCQLHFNLFLSLALKSFFNVWSFAFFCSYIKRSAQKQFSGSNDTIFWLKW